MARDWRIQFEDAVYHVMCRGVGRGRLFLADEDCQRFESYLEAAVEKFDLELYAYVLMPNHYHILVRTKQANLSRAVQWVQGSYAMYFNLKRSRPGHLFQGRFKSVLVEDEGYFAALSGYIHLNPLRAGLARDAGQYRWSSCGDYAGRRERRRWISMEGVLSTFGGEPSEQPAAYRQWLREISGKERKVLEGVRHGFILGDEEFVERIRKEFGHGRTEELPRKSSIRKAGVIERVKKAAKQVFGASEAELLSKARGRKKEARDAAIYVLASKTDLKNSEIGRAFGVRYAAVSNASSRASDRLADSPDYAAKVKSLMELLD